MASLVSITFNLLLEAILFLITFMSMGNIYGHFVYECTRFLWVWALIKIEHILKNREAHAFDVQLLSLRNNGPYFLKLVIFRGSCYRVFVFLHKRSYTPRNIVTFHGRININKDYPNYQYIVVIFKWHLISSTPYPAFTRNLYRFTSLLYCWVTFTTEVLRFVVFTPRSHLLHRLKNVFWVWLYSLYTISNAAICLARK